MKIFCSVLHFLRGRLARGVLTGFAFAGVILFAPFDLGAQEGQGAVIYHVAGNDFALSVDGRRLVFPASAVGASGITLNRSGIIHNGPGTFLEVQLIPSGTVIKVAENTSLVYNGLDEAGKFDELGFLYGKIRIVTGDAGTPVVIRCGGVSAKLTNGDFGADYLLKPDNPNSVSRPLFQVYAFRGGAEVFPYGAGGQEAAYFGTVDALTANTGECLFFDIAASQKASRTFAEKKPIDMNAAAYWMSHGFLGSPPMPVPDTRLVAAEKKEAAPAEVPAPAPEPEIEPAAVPVTEPDPASIEFPKQPAPVYYGKNITLGLGLFLTVASAVALGVTHPDFIIDYPDKDLVKNIHSMTYLPLGLGLLTILGGIMYNPTEK